MTKELTIYLSLKEVEDLIFNRIIEIPSNRLSITKAQGLFSISVKLNQEDLLIQRGTNYVLLYSAIRMFEVPGKEKKLFSGHFKIPEGYISYLASRKVRDVNQKESVHLLQTNDNLPYQNFLLVRNGCVGLYNQNCTSNWGKPINDSVKRVLHLIFSGSMFRDRLLEELLKEGGFPIKEVKTQKIITDRYFRVVWLLTIVNEMILKNSDNINANQIEASKKWLKNLLEIDNLDSIRYCLNSVPEIFLDEINCILGYYFAVIRFEDYCIDKTQFYNFIVTLDYSDSEDLKSWSTFYLSMFDTDVQYLYFSPLILDDIYEIECNCYFFLTSKEKVNLTKLLNVNHRFNQEQLIENFLILKNGLTNEFPEVIQEYQIDSKLTSSLTKENLKFIGLESEDSNYYGKIDISTCDSKKEYINLKLIQNCNVSDITFYLEKDSVCFKTIKSMHFKVKTIDKLLSNKKVLLCFLYLDDFNYNLLFHIYCMFASKINSIEKIVIVLLVNLDSYQVQTLEFDRIYRESQIQISKMFNFKCEFIIRNERNNDSTEIKRNLRNVIGDYKTSQVEVIDDNLTIEKKRWIIESTKGFWIEQKEFNYYSFLNSIN